MLYLFDDYTLDTERRELRRGAGRVPIEPQVFDLLEYLIRSRGRVVSKDDLLARYGTAAGFGIAADQPHQRGPHTHR